MYKRQIVTIGIKPNEPATGYGYIQKGKALPAPKAAKKYKTTFNQAKRFVEKPKLKTAIQYLDSGDYSWNAGMFIWSVATITDALHEHQPEMEAACRRWLAASASPVKLKRVLKKEYPEIKKVSIDYALMEKAKNVVVADGSFRWDDLGSWTALSRHIKADRAGNCAVGDFINVDGARNIVFDARTKGRTPIAIVGLKDSIVVQTDDALMVASKEDAQKIKELVAKLSASKAYRKLV